MHDVDWLKNLNYLYLAKCWEGRFVRMCFLEKIFEHIIFGSKFLRNTTMGKMLINSKLLKRKSIKETSF